MFADKPPGSSELAIEAESKPEGAAPEASEAGAAVEGEGAAPAPKVKKAPKDRKRSLGELGKWGVFVRDDDAAHPLFKEANSACAVRRPRLPKGHGPR